MTERDSMTWDSETFAVEDLGTMSATGSRAQGLLVSERGTCRVGDSRAEFVAWWSIDERDLLTLGPVSARRSDGRRMSDEDLDCLRHLIGNALSEWWTTTEAKEMVTENERRDRQRPPEPDGTAARRECLRDRLSAGNLAPYEIEAAIRDAC